MRRTNRILWSIACIFLAVAATAQSLPSTGDVALPPVRREFRALWVATVDNIDWPSKPNLPTRAQKAELIAILDEAVKLHLNVVVLQIRPACDAFYSSKIEPWSEYLTGRMGQAPKPFYDPLQFAVEEAHKRGLELHAWMNPYRARLRYDLPPAAPNHVTVTHPALVRRYGKYLWLDPTEAATRDYSLRVIMDVVRRYDIDGIHFDDYFYPYPEKAHGENAPELPFPDDASWALYQRTGGKSARDDWRRENVSLFVRSVNEAIKREKPWVKFGISPFGIWQPHRPEPITGFNAFDKLYCDSRQWLADGWVDYLVPQLYWPIGQRAQSFATLLKWWTAQNTQHRLLAPGMRVSGWKNVESNIREATDEIELTRELGAAGEVLWHSKPLMTTHTDVAEALRRGVYAEPALVPAWPWLGRYSPATPVLTVRPGRREVKMNWRDDTGGVSQWVVRKRTEGRWTTEILPREVTKENVPALAGESRPEVIAISAVNRYGNMSEPAIWTAGQEK